MKILTVLGARPQFIKASVVSAAIKQLSGLSEITVHTGQHFDANMSDVFFKELGMLPPDYHLGIHGGNHGAMTGRMLESIEQVTLDVKPDIMLVYGDTNSTLAGALAAAKLHIPVAHIEAGLRSFNMQMPEEINRILTDRVSTWLFAPTEDAVSHLKNEGILPEKVYRVGDVMYDVALHHGRRADEWHTNVLKRIGLQSKEYVLVTVHRAENTDDLKRLSAIVDALIDVSLQVQVVWPLHPRTRKVLENLGMLGRVAKHIRLLEPLGYIEMVQLERMAAVIATDSGGVQKEAFFYEVPCVTLRNETEWVELVESGWNRLAPPDDASNIANKIMAARDSLGKAIRPYGDGDAANRVVAQLNRG